ncbi:MAG: membrane dipeptidase [Sphingomonadaceae bacterium]
MPLDRRLLLAGAAAAVAAPYVARASVPVSPRSARAYSRRAITLVRESLVIDMLAPLRIEVTPEYYAAALSSQEAADFLASGITGFHHAFGLGGPNAREQALSYLAIWGNFAARNSHVFSAIGSVSDLLRAKREGRCGVIMGIQNADQFQTVADVRFFHQIGLRCAQLTYNSQNRIGSGATDRVDGGVSDFGASIIAAMNEVGMLVDVSHCGDRTTLDAIALSKQPVSITHSNCRALVDHPRLKTDEAIKAMAATGGVMGITGVRMFVRASEPVSVAHVVDHVDHVAKLVGIEHVGVGTDADLYGYDSVSAEFNKRLRAGYKESYAFRDRIDVDGFDHPLKIYDLTEELIRRGYSDSHVRLVLGGNFQRMLKAVWGV